ncbi:MAG: type II secretion system protein [Deltaproteobacteria bacterium]|nr:type II secretion system protein [Deltaproteobacteria bacterium]
MMVSLVILAVGLTAMLQLFGNLNDAQTHQRLLVQALHVGEATMEGLIYRYANDTDLDPGSHAGPSFGVDGQPGGAFFTTDWNVTPDVPFAGVREVVVTVHWSERGLPKTFSLRTVRT